VDRGSKVMANRTAAILFQMFETGLDRELVDANPVRRGLRPGGTEASRERTLTDAELAAFLSDPTACVRLPRLAHVIQILLLTAVRRGELVQAKWRDVDLEGKTWTIPAENSKTAKAYIVPLSDWAVKEFTQLKKAAGRSQWVLPGEDPSQHMDAKLLTRSLARNLTRMKKAGIQPFTLHDLRRTTRTGLGDKLGIAPHVAERCLNHSIGGMVGVYDKGDYIDARRAALDAWAAHLQGLTAGNSEAA
jgi:integrase